VNWFFLRPRDIATYVGSGTLEVGVTGRDLLLDSGAEADEVMALDFARSTFRFAAPRGSVTELADLAGRRIATSYPGLVDAYLRERGIQAGVVRLDGAVETAVQLGVADVIADVVETGATLRAHGLEIFGDPILRSEAVLISRRGVATDPRVGVLVRRLQGVLVARQYVLMDYDCPVDLVEQAVAVTPGLESPTVSPLHDAGWVAVRAMVPRKGTNQVMDDLYALGARAIIVTGIHACRL
jgi:ATP phosphoribosyltransferase